MADFKVTNSASGQWILSVESRVLRFNRQYYYATEAKLAEARGPIEEVFNRREAAVLGKNKPEPVVTAIPDPEPTMPATVIPETETDDWEITDPGATLPENVEDVEAEVAASVTPEPVPEPEPDAEDAGLPTGTAASILAWVNEQPDRNAAALEALAAETAGKERKTLIANLQRILTTVPVIDEEE